METHSERRPVGLVQSIQGVSKDTPLTDLEDTLFRAHKRAEMHRARYEGHLAAAKEMLDRRVRLAYAILTISVPLFVAYGARIALGSTGFDLSRILIPLIGIALCYVAVRVEHAHYKKNGESLIMATAMEEEDDSTNVDGLGRLAAEQHIRGYGLSSVGAAATVVWIVWITIAALEISWM